MCGSGKNAMYGGLTVIAKLTGRHIRVGRLGDQCETVRGHVGAGWSSNCCI